ncbi:hypothetical protein PPTG_23624 [Phytophthora nicotianae INRA-310]|uniref:Uncharacterized protein n=4 Tax=Phytophthora nicotianae TaxID=4792 RepID=W2PVV0_PHYN3|nr:hypothetical protein PPTG_23624 [Phytophthora nicotianae INRA-310]ETI39678.1 hypothetical protein F443_14734 [Phytophthora nicotianae P1569]ETM39679.1 hypothetical protein L914_14174 [Phytophthora nicotianae]ETN04150.1 hypothetical protein PPTG_23624 [Phytophthora nicotianae INRA-310]ETO68396.1 hypothetical protein F444_14746 [Phytophthora nicotianae P1976]
MQHPESNAHSTAVVAMSGEAFKLGTDINHRIN